MAEHRKQAPRGEKPSVRLASPNGEAGDTKDLMQFVRSSVAPVSEAFAQTPLKRLRIKTAEAAITLVKAAAPVREIAPPSSELPRAQERAPHAARIHNPETGRAYDTISSGVVGIFRDLPEPPATGDKLTAGQTLGYIEALRLRNAVYCPGECTLIAQVVVEGQPVDFGETLFVIDSAQPPIEPEAEPPTEPTEVTEPTRL